MEPIILHFYTRNRCHLCENAKNILLELQKDFHFTIEEHDIDLSDELTERYGLMIPVIVMDEEEVEYGNVNKLVISKRLQEKSSFI